MNFSLFLWCMAIVFVTLLGGCNEGLQENVVSEENAFTMYADSVFLGFEGDLIYPDIIWGNVKTYLPAFERMKAHLKIKGERLAWDFKNGAELNISENIHDYVTGIWGRQNKKMDSGEYKLEFVGGDYRVVPTVLKEELPL